MAFCVLNCANVLPNDISTEYLGYACLFGKILEIAGVSLSQPNCLFETVRNWYKLGLDCDLLFLIMLQFLWYFIKNESDWEFCENAFILYLLKLLTFKRLESIQKDLLGLEMSKAVLWCDQAEQWFC